MTLTREQHRALFDALNRAGMDCWRGKAIEVLFPLVRDLVLDQAIAECERALTFMEDKESMRRECVDAIRRLKRDGG